MTNSNYVSINSILYDLSLMLDSKHWNENSMKEWLNMGYRQLNIFSKYEEKVKSIEVFQHKADLPSDLVYLTQLAEYLGDGCEIESNRFRALKLSANSFYKSTCMYPTECDVCLHEFKVNPDNSITTTLPVGILLVSYLGYPTSEDGFLIPDYQPIKEALLHYVLYRYWMSKYQVKEEGADSRMQFHLSMWNTLSKKAQSINLPDVNTLENLKNMNNRMIHSQEDFLNFFNNSTQYAGSSF